MSSRRQEVHRQVQQIRMKFEKEIADFIVSHPMTTTRSSERGSG